MSEPQLPLDIDHTCKTSVLMAKPFVDGRKVSMGAPVYGVDAERKCPACQYERGWRDATTA